MTRIHGLTVLALTLALGGSASCGGGARGDLEVRLGGEQAAEVGWPFEADGEVVGFADGWSMAIDRVVVSVASFALRGGDGETASLAVDPVVADLGSGPVLAWRIEGVPARRWEDVSWVVAPPTASARRLGGAREEDVSRMIAEGWSILLEGRATHPSHGTFEVSVCMPLEVANERCEGADGTLGVVVPASGVARTELTFHLDHVFFDSLGDRAPEMRFQAWAAAAGEDRRVTLADLARQPLADLRDLDGSPLGVVYDPGPVPLSSSDLRAFVAASTATVGHLDGEGHCDYAPAR
jgi:hypothetical protein